MPAPTGWISVVRRIVLSVPLTLVLFGSPASGQEEPEGEGANVKAVGSGDTAEDGAVDAVALAAELARYGYRESSPLALVNAASLLISQPVQAGEESKESEPGKGVQQDKEGESSQDRLDPRVLLDDAAGMADGDEALQAMIAELRASALPTRGAVGGPIVRYSEVLAYSTDYWTIRFRGGEWASLRVIGDGDTDLDCWVYDQNGNLIDSDTDYTDYCILGWTPRWTGPFRLRIKNWGSVWNGYQLITN